MWISVLYGDRCTLCGQVYSIGINVLYGVECTLCGQVHSDPWKLWGQLYSTLTSCVLYVETCEKVYSMWKSVLYGDKCTLCEQE